LQAKDRCRPLTPRGVELLRLHLSPQQPPIETR
jgi:hypothetical protein